MGVRATDLRKGTVIEKDGDLLVITEYHHHTPGNLRAIIQIKTKNLRTGSVGQIRAGSSDSFEVAYLDRKRCEYLYKESSGDYMFMDMQSYEQFPLPDELAADRMGFVKENTQVDVTFHGTTPIDVVLPATVELTVTESEVAVKGNTATNVKKEAIVETGMMVKVPLHISVGDKIKISTETGDFMGRVQGD
jgi:elongation factor P